MFGTIGLSLFILIGTVGYSGQLRGVLIGDHTPTEIIVGIEELANVYVLPELKGLFPQQRIVTDAHNLELARAAIGTSGHQWEDQPDGGFARKYLAPQEPKKTVYTGWVNPNTEVGHANGR